MNYQEAKQAIIERTFDLLPHICGSAIGKHANRPMFVCPICNAGAKNKNSGLTVNPKSASGYGLRCNFGECGFSGSIFDLWNRLHGGDFKSALGELAGMAGIYIDDWQNESPSRNAAASVAAVVFSSANNTANEKDAPPPISAPRRDLPKYFRECQARLNTPPALAYLQKRGISYETAARLGLGYDPAADIADTGKYKEPRIIIPLTDTAYIGRAVSPDADPKFKAPFNKGGKAYPFNAAALYADNEAVFVVEGAFDALALEELGYPAVATNSTNHINALLKLLEEKPTTATLILSLDKDDAGRKGEKELAEKLRLLHVSFICADIAGGHKDANDNLTKDRNDFIAAAEKAWASAGERPDNIQGYLLGDFTADLDFFKGGIGRKTGYSNLDEKAGGLYPGLYVIAATTSLGKTTFALQMADYLAAAGEDVIFFTLEQSRLELVTKSLARLAAIADPQEKINPRLTSLGIRRAGLTEQIAALIEDYTEKVSDRLSIVEGNFNCNADFICDYVRRYVKRNKTRPIVFIDYLQILQQKDTEYRQTTREHIDSAVTQLARLSRERGMELTIFLISSVNRANYLMPIDYDSLKETGSIEYSASVIWGLQLQCLRDDLFNSEKDIKKKREKIKEAKNAVPRKMELVCLKNRYGKSNFSCCFDYYSANEYFVPDHTKKGNDDKPENSKPLFPKAGNSSAWGEPVKKKYEPPM